MRVKVGPWEFGESTRQEEEIVQTIPVGYGEEETPDPPATTIMDYLQKSLQKNAELNGHGNVQLSVEEGGFKAIVQSLNNRKSLVDLYNIVYSIPELRSAIYNLRRGIFRRGITISPKFASKCMHCGTEYANLTKICTNCSHKTRPPDVNQKTELEEYIRDVNDWNQSLSEVLSEGEDDLSVVDDAFILIPRYYVLDPSTNIIFGRPTQIVRHEPSSIEFDIDTTGIPGHKRGACKIHRSQGVVRPFEYDTEGNVKPETENCPICNLPLEPVMFVARFKTGTMYLFSEEVIHYSKYSPSKLYGFPPVLSVLESALAVSGADRNFFKLFWERKLPRGMIVSVTNDVPGMKAERESIQANLRRDPEYVPWIIQRDTEKGRAETKWVSLGGETSSSVVYDSLTKSLRERLPMIWGVVPPRSGTTATGSMNDYQVFLWAIEDGQQIYNDKVFPKIGDAWGMTDWKLELKLPEERLENAMLERLERESNIATKLYAMGFDISINESGKIIFSGRSMPHPSPDGQAQQPGSGEDLGDPNAQITPEEDNPFQDDGGDDPFSMPVGRPPKVEETGQTGFGQYDRDKNGVAHRPIAGETRPPSPPQPIKNSRGANFDSLILPDSEDITDE